MHLYYNTVAGPHLKVTSILFQSGCHLAWQVMAPIAPPLTNARSNRADAVLAAETLGDRQTWSPANPDPSPIPPTAL